MSTADVDRDELRDPAHERHATTHGHASHCRCRDCAADLQEGPR